MGLNCVDDTSSNMGKHFSWIYSSIFCVFFVASCETVRQPSVVESEMPVAALRPLGPAESAAWMPDVWPADAPEIFAGSAILIDARMGEVLFQKNADEVRPVASTQKLLTALLVVRAGNLDKVVHIMPSDVQVEPSKLGIRPGERYSRRLLLAAMMVRSSNDAAMALARDVAGSVESFMEWMNRAAGELGARRSYFANPHGLPAAQYSTARDIAKIAFAAYREPELRKLMMLKTLTIRLGSGRTVVLENTNELLKRMPACNGMKTGYTVAAGRCLVASAKLGSREMILVQLGSKTQHIFNDAQRVFAWALRR